MTPTIRRPDTCSRVLPPASGGRSLRYASLALGLAFAVAGCNRSSSDGSGDDLGDPLPTSSSPSSNATIALFASLGQSFVTGGTSGVESTLTGWALGQLGLAGTDSTGAALAQIESTLQDIDTQLKDIAAEISELVTDTVVANCENLSTTVNDDLSRIHTLIETYNTIICTGNGSCANGAPPSNVTEDTLMNFVDQVLDTANGGANGMDAILDRIQQDLVGTTGGGILQACMNPAIPGLAVPVDGTFNDADYYTRVQPIAAYYYYYQTVALLLYCEAQRYMAYLTAGGPNTDTLDPDDMQDFLLHSTDPSVVFLMNETAQRMQTTWDNLRNQFNLVGAPYTNADRLIHNHAAAVVYVLDLDAFTVAAGENCSDLTTDNYECTSVLRGPYDLSAEPIKDVEYADQKGHWSFATPSDMANIMDGWNGSTAWQYLTLNNGTTTRGFKNIENKVLCANQVLSGSYSYSPSEYTNLVYYFNYVPFIDTNLDYGTPGLNHHLPVDNSTAIWGQIAITNVGYPTSIVSAHRTSHDFLDCQGGSTGDTTLHQDVVWTSAPGWAPEAASTQRGTAFHLPVIHIDSIGPNEGLQAKNAVGVWTMCTKDYEDWFAAIVPPPVFQ